MNVCTRRLTKFSTQSLIKQHRFVVGQVSMRDIERKWKLVVVVASIKTMFEQLEILSIYGIIFTWANRNLKKRKDRIFKRLFAFNLWKKKIFLYYIFVVILSYVNWNCWLLISEGIYKLQIELCYNDQVYVKEMQTNCDCKCGKFILLSCSI